MNNHPASGLAVLIALGALLAGVPVGLASEEADAPTALRTIMLRLGEGMQAVSAAISREDWAEVGRLAPAIADHEQPPLAEKIRILAWLGSDAGQFRGFDARVHGAASAMAEAAHRQDGIAVIASFAEVQQACLACHSTFRQRYIGHFRDVQAATPKPSP